MAFVFGWPLSELQALDLDQLAAHRERAIALYNRVHGQKDT
ncbi:GpE family phage tail protein [uncultured Brevundimonas sp.]